jgi:predicted nucleic acid-binding protein
MLGAPYLIAFKTLVNQHALFGLGIGYVDAHLLAAVVLSPETALWTRDKRFRGVADKLGVAANPLH